MLSCGIEPLEPPPRARWESVSVEELGRLPGGERGLLMLAQSEIGRPGTRTSGGRITVEHNPRLRPFLARGSVSRPGTNEEVYRSEPIVFNSVNQIGGLLCHASYEPHIPESTPADVAAQIERQHRALQYVVKRDDVLVNASSFVKHGFAPFEVIWETDTEPVLASLQFREQSTVNRWFFDEQQRNWLGTEFSVGGDAGNTYTLPHGRTRSTARSVLVNLWATGLNLEGVSPIRVITGLRKLKELILQSFGVSYQRFATPIAVIAHQLVDATAGIFPQLGGEEHKGEVQELINRIQQARSRLPNVLPLPAGRELSWVVPNADMPDPKPMLDYIDMMMALVFSNEGALLGSQSFGSYAMALQSDARFMRSSPMYAGRVSAMFTQLLHLGLEFAGHDLRELEELPEYRFRFEGTQDSSAWLADAVSVMGSSPGAWPDDLRRSAAARLGLPESAFDAMASAPMRDEEE